MATINGNNSANTLNGTADADLITAFGGNDTVTAGEGGDTVFGGSGGDSLLGQGGDDSLDGGSGTDFLFGGDGADSLFGGSQGDSLDGGAGDDLLDGGSGNDTLIGGAGRDTATFAGSGASVAVDLGAGTATGTSTGTDTLTGVENVTGSGFADAITGNGLDNLLDGGAGSDTLAGGLGSDTILGGAGDDSIAAGPETQPSPVALDFNWSLAGADEADIRGGVVQDTGGIEVRVGFVNDGAATEFSVESSTTTYVAPGEPFAPASSAYLYGSGGNETATITLDFAAVPGSGLAPEVGDVTFRLQDVDRVNGAWEDIVTVLAWDAEGNPVPVTLTPAGADVVSGNTVTAVEGNDTATSAGGSVLVSIPGPVARIAIDYGNGFVNGQLIQITDVHFTATPTDNDLVDAGEGSDAVSGGWGDDTLLGGAGGDTLSGGEGSDSLDGGEGADLVQGGAGRDTILGGIGDTVDGGGTGDDVDVLDLTAWGKAQTNILFDPLNGENGTVEFLDGTGAVIGTLSFTDIETVVPCFTPGTRIATPRGPRAVETLRAGERVLTRDGGAQEVLWAGRRDLSAGDLAAAPELLPVRIRAGALGPGCPARDLVVSPQHRMLLAGARAELLFGEPEVLVAATHLVGLPGVARRPPRRVSYLHILCERHEILRAEGAWTESFQPAARMVDAMAAESRDEILALFPALAARPMASARPTLRAHEARALRAA